MRIIHAVLAATMLAGLGGGAGAQTVGSTSLGTMRSCATTAADTICDGTLPGQAIVTRQSSGGVGVGGLNYFNAGGGNIAWSDVQFDAAVNDLPVLRGYTAAPGDLRMNINVYGFQSFVYGGATASDFSITGGLHIVNSSNNPTDGALPGGAIYSQYVAIWDPSILAGLTTADELFNNLFYADCSTTGVLGFATSTGSLPGGEFSSDLTTTACAAGSLTLAPGQEVLVVAGMQLPVNRGGFADSTATFRTRLGDDLSADTRTMLAENLESAIDRGAVVAVPEPATWAMMIGGFGLLGATVRRRRTAQLA